MCGVCVWGGRVEGGVGVWCRGQTGGSSTAFSWLLVPMLILL